MNRETEPKLPESLWEHVPTMFDNSVWDLKLSDGSVHLDMYISDDGTIRGKVVGGQDGMVPPPEEIKINPQLPHVRDTLIPQPLLRLWPK